MSEANKKNDMELTDAAWARLQQKLSAEAESPQWSRWSAQLTAASSMMPAGSENAEDAPAAEASGSSTQHSRVQLSAEADGAAADRKPNAFGEWMRKRKRWVAAAAAVSVVAVTIATPAGNQALAAILNKFRMQQLTVVQENDLQAILNGAFGDGKERQSINTFGEFTQVSGKAIGEADANEAAKALGHKVVIPKDYDGKEKIYVSPSNSITFKMNVDEVNKAMQRLGAKKLMPQSVDGKPITLEMGSSTHLYVSNQSEDKKNTKGYSLTQTPLPTVTVDPSIPMKEALDAIMQFPLLPDDIRQNLQTAGILQGGSVPLPIIESGQVEKVKVDGVEVIVSGTSYNDEKQQRTYFTATWVKEGQLFRLSGNNLLTDKEAVVNKVSELIKS